MQTGDGCYFIDETGVPILDGLAGLWCVNVGYNCREIVDAVTAQMTRLPYYPSFLQFHHGGADPCRGIPRQALPRPAEPYDFLQLRL